MEAEEEYLRLRNEVLSSAARDLLMGEGGGLLDHISEEVGDSDVANDIVAGLRKNAAGEMEKTDALIDEIDKDRKDAANNCHGSLKMRAATNGRVYTVTVCTSDSVNEYSSGKTLHIPTHVETRRV